MLEAFSKIGSDKDAERRNAGSQILAHVLENPKELEYSVTRLIRGLESSKLTTRHGSYSSLAILLGMDKLNPTELRQLVSKTLVTDQQTSKKERRIVYIARILACGVILRTVPISKLIYQEELLRGILEDLVELGGRRSTLLNLATPFICHLLGEKELTQEAFDSFVWPTLQPIFCKTEVPVKTEEGDEEQTTEVKDKSEKSAAILQIALASSVREFKTDFDFISDMGQVVRIILGNRINTEQVVDLLLKHITKNSLSEEFWNTLVPQIRSSHFETVCICIKKSVEGGMPLNHIIREEIVAPLLSVFRNDDASEQHSEAEETLNHLLKWKATGQDVTMGKKERKAAMKVLFSGSPNLLHEYKKLNRILNQFVKETCTEKDLSVLAAIIDKGLNKEGISVRLAITSLQFLSKIAQVKKSRDELKVTIGKRILSIGFQKEKLNFLKPSATKKEDEDDLDDNDDNDDDKVKTKENGHEISEEISGKQQLLSTSALEAFQSILTNSFSPQFMEEMFQFVIDELDSFTTESSVKKTIKKIEKLRAKKCDPNMNYLMGAYAIQLVLEQNKVLGEAQEVMEELLSISSSASKENATPEIVRFILSSVLKDERPPFDYEAMFQKLTIDNKITEVEIQQFADVIDVDVNEGEENSSEDESGSDEDEDEEMRDVDEKENSDEEDDEDVVVSPKKINLKKQKKRSKDDENEEEEEEDDDDSDGLSSVDMDEATEEDLKTMDKALAKVFANKKKIKEEETSDMRSLMRTFRLLEAYLTRQSKNCLISIPLILLLPIIHSLQNSIRGKKTSSGLSTRIVSVLNKLNGIKKLEDVESVESGTFYTIARDLVAMSKLSGNKIIADLLGDSVVMLTKCYLESQSTNKTKGEKVGFITLYKGMMDLTGDSRNKNMGITSNLICSALTTLPNWNEGKNELCKRILEIIFDPKLRIFRRMQFLILLRAALSDKGTASSQEMNSWKLKAMKDLLKQSTAYLSLPLDKNTSQFTKELLATLTDSRSDPELSKLASSSFLKFSKIPAIVDMVKIFSRSSPQLRAFLNSIGLENLVFVTNKDKKKLTKKKGEKVKRKAAIVDEEEVQETETPKKKKKVKKN